MSSVFYNVVYRTSILLVIMQVVFREQSLSRGTSHILKGLQSVLRHFESRSFITLILTYNWEQLNVIIAAPKVTCDQSYIPQRGTMEDKSGRLTSLSVNIDQEYPVSSSFALLSVISVRQELN